MKLRTRLAAIAASALLLVGVGAVPANAWGSASTGASFACIGWTNGSSAVTATRMSASTGVVGGACPAHWPSSGAQYRTSGGSLLTACTSTGNYCSSSRASISGYVGGRHYWGTATVLT